MAGVDIYFSAFQLFGGGYGQIAECRTQYQPHGHGLCGVVDRYAAHFVVVAGRCGAVFVFAEAHRSRCVPVVVEFPGFAGHLEVGAAALGVDGEFKELLGVGQEQFADFYPVCFCGFDLCAAEVAAVAVDVGAVVAYVDETYARRNPQQVDCLAVDFGGFFFKRGAAHVETVFAGIGCRFDYYDGHRVAVGVELLAGKCGVVVFVKCDWGNFDFLLLGRQCTECENSSDK